MTVSAAPPSHRARAVDIQPRKLLQDFAYSLVSVTCWLAINCVAAAGIIPGLSVLMANSTVDQSFAETANLYNHYGAADTPRPTPDRRRVGQEGVSTGSTEWGPIP